MLGHAYCKAVWAWKEVSRAIMGTPDDNHWSNPTDMAGLRSAFCPVLTPATRRTTGGDVSNNTFQPLAANPQYLSENYNHNTNAPSTHKIKKHSRRHGKNSFKLKIDKMHPRYHNNDTSINFDDNKSNQTVIVRAPTTLKTPNVSEIITISGEVEQICQDRSGVGNTIYRKSVCERYVNDNSDDKTTMQPRCSSDADSGLVSCTDSENWRNGTPNPENSQHLAIDINGLATIMSSSHLHSHRGAQEGTQSSGYSQSSHFQANIWSPSQTNSSEINVSNHVINDAPLPFCSGSPVPFRPIDNDNSTSPILGQPKTITEHSSPSIVSSPSTPPWYSRKRDDPTFIPSSTRKSRQPLASNPRDCNVFYESSKASASVNFTHRPVRKSDPCNPCDDYVPSANANDPLGHVDHYQYPPSQAEPLRFQPVQVSNRDTPFSNPFDEDFKRATKQRLQFQKFKRKVSISWYLIHIRQIILQGYNNDFRISVTYL